MKRQQIDGKSGRWFDKDTATVWEERVSDDEMHYRNHHDHDGETLYYTDRGTFVLNHWDTRATNSFELIDQETAARWLISNGYWKDIGQLELQAEERRLQI